MSRKKLVKEIEERIGIRAKYLGPPTFAYQIGDITVDRYGNVTGEEKEMTEEDTLTVKVPIDGFGRRQVDNLINLVYSKQKLLNASVGRDAFFVSEGLVDYLREEKNISRESAIEVASRFGETKGFSFEDDSVLFTGFSYAEGDEVMAYASVAAMIVSYARNHKKIHAKISDTENEKYAMRIWLNQIGLSGKGGKETRRVMMKRLSGDAAFRTDESKAKWEENRRSQKCSE